jgi:ABC-type transport system involved in multi-copper enzyme maturation permease subunit
MKLFKIELRKLLYNRMFWLSIAGYIAAIVSILLLVRFSIIKSGQVSKDSVGANFLPSEIYHFPGVWHNIAYLSRFIKVFLAVIMVTIVTNEFNYNTLKQSVINGLSRFELVLSKFYVLLMMSFFGTFIIFAFGGISGVMFTDRVSWWKFASQLHYVGAYFLMLVTFLSFVAFLSFLIKRPGAVLGILLFYIFALEPIFSLHVLEDSIGPYLPMKVMNDLIQTPPNALSDLFNQKQFDGAIPLTNVFACLAYILFFNGVSYLTLRNRDL